MGQRQSKFVSDNPEVQEIYELTKSEGMTALQRYLDVKFSRLKNESVKFGIIGMSCVGKSTFINSICGLKEGDERSAAVGRGNTTQYPTFYPHPEDQKIVFADLPGFGTTQFPKAKYIENMSLRSYNYFFILFDTVLQEDDIWIMRQLSNLSKPFSLVRMKIDKDIKLGLKWKKTQEETLTRIRKKIESEMAEQKELGECVDIFLISGKKTSIGEMDKLKIHIPEILSSIKTEKCKAVAFPFVSMSHVVIEEKHKLLKKRCNNITPMYEIHAPGVDFELIMTIVVNEIMYYINEFGLFEKQMKSFQSFDNSQLNCKGILFKKLSLNEIEITVGQQFAATVSNVCQSLAEIYFLLRHTETFVKLVYKFLNDYLDDLKHDALIVYDHVTLCC